jgi:hypothetical protein
MIQNNISLPHLYGYVRTSFCGDPDVTGLVPCVIFGAEAVPGQSLLFHVLREDGVLYSQLPLHALAHEDSAPPRPLEDLIRWDTFGWNLSVIRYDYLREMTFRVRLPKGEEYGTYECTIDFFDNGFSDEPTQHKHLHLLALEDGNYALQSNDFCRVNDASFVRQDLFEKPVQLKRQEYVWTAEP